jgi:mannosyltransferase
MSTRASTPATSVDVTHARGEGDQSRSQRPRRPQPIEIVIGLTVLAAILRFATLNVQSIWADEAATVVLVRPGLHYLTSHIAYNETTPPLYFLLVWAWTKIFGASVLGFRSFSAVAGTVTIPLVYVAGRWISPRVGLWAAALATVNPVMYYYSQEARSYALLILLSTAAIIFWQRALQSPSRRDLTLWAGMSALALLTHYFSAFLFIPEALILARRLSVRRVLPYASAVGVVGLALLPLAAKQLGEGKGNWIEQSSLASRLAQVPKQFLVGLYSPLEIFTTLLGLLLVAGAVALIVRRGEERERRLALELAILAAAALLLPALLAVTHLVDVFNGRNVTATWIPCAIVVAAGLGARRAGRAGALIGGALCLLSLLVVVAVNAVPGYQRDNWRGVASALRTSAGGRVVVGRVVVGPELSSAPLIIYRPELVVTKAADLSTREIDFVNLRTRRTGRSPLPPVVPTAPPSGFRLAEVHRTETYAVSRFLAPRAAPVAARVLRRMLGESTAEVMLQR